MPMLSWNEGLSCNIKIVDDQHMKLVDMVNHLHDSMKEEADDKVLFEIIDEMNQYTKEHFKTEEELMDQYGDPNAELHKSEHSSFIEKVKEVQENLKSGKVVLSMDILNFLSDWLVTHINDTDKKMGEYLATKGVS